MTSYGVKIEWSPIHCLFFKQSRHEVGCKALCSINRHSLQFVCSLQLFYAVMALKIPPTAPSHPVQKFCDGSYVGLYSKLVVQKIPQLWSLCQFVFAIAHNIFQICCITSVVSAVASPLPTFTICPISTDGPITYQSSPSPGWGGGFGYH